MTSVYLYVILIRHPLPQAGIQTPLPQLGIHPLPQLAIQSYLSPQSVFFAVFLV